MNHLQHLKTPFHMTLTVIQQFGAPTETSNASWEHVAEALAQLEPDLRPAVIVIDPKSDSYMQCAGSSHRLTVERRNVTEISFKHYRYGLASLDKGWHKVAWSEITCSVGPIPVHASEVLTIEDAKKLFRSFFERTEDPKGYRTRNMTKIFKEGPTE